MVSIKDSVTSSAYLELTLSSSAKTRQKFRVRSICLPVSSSRLSASFDIARMMANWELDISRTFSLTRYSRCRERLDEKELADLYRRVWLHGKFTCMPSRPDKHNALYIKISNYNVFWGARRYAPFKDAEIRRFCNQLS